MTNGKAVHAATLFYLLLPLVLFAFGWLKIYLACLVVVLLITALFFSLNDMTLVEIHFDKKQVNIALAISILVMLWVGLSGIGEILFQNSDHEVRNVIFHDLIQYS